MNILELKNVSLGYGKHIVLKNVNLEIKKGEFITIVGQNGSGKSTFVKALLSLITPLKGEIKYINIKKNHIGYMPQLIKVDSNFPASVYEIVCSGCLNKLGSFPFYRKKEKNLVAKNMKTLGIYDLKNKNFSDLSGGQRQKVLLARSLCSTNDLLILDEPSNNLDLDSKKELYEIIKKLNKEEQITIMLITHDLDKDDLIGDKIISLNDNNVFFGTKKEYLDYD